MPNSITETTRERESITNTEDADGKCQVLLVDDDPGFLATTGGILADHVDLVTCASAEQALRLLGSRTFHLVCSDYRMPGLNGSELLQRVAALPYFASTLLITGSDEFIRAPSTGNQHYVILKPFEPDRFVRLALQLARLARMKRTVRSLTDSVTTWGGATSGPASVPPPTPPPSSRGERSSVGPPSWRRR